MAQLSAGARPKPGDQGAAVPGRSNIRCSGVGKFPKAGNRLRIVAPDGGGHLGQRFSCGVRPSPPQQGGKTESVRLHVVNRRHHSVCRPLNIPPSLSPLPSGGRTLLRPRTGALRLHRSALLNSNHLYSPSNFGASNPLTAMSVTGRNSATTMVPTITARMMIITGSSSDVIAATALSTSSS